MSLTLNKTGDPIARIVFNDEDKSKFIYLCTEKKEESLKVKDSSLLDIQLNETQIMEIAKLAQQGLTLREIAEGGGDSDSEEDCEDTTTSIELSSDESISVMPSSKSQRVLLGGPAGVGKSTLAANYALEYQNIFPERLVHLFCRTGDDPAFRYVEREEIVIQDDIQQEVIELDDLANSLVIFDDVDNLQNKKTRDYIHKLINDVMCNGRKLNIHVVYIGHTLLNGQQSKVINNESNLVFLFNGVGSRQNENFLKTYAGMKKSEIDFITELPVRWMCLSRDYPRYLIHEKGVMMV